MWAEIPANGFETGDFLAIPYLDGQFDFACITDLMFENEMKKDLYLHHLNENGYITKHKQINDLLYIVYPVPIR
jgi:methyltransferase-like protein